MPKGHWCSWFLGFQTQIEAYTIAFSPPPLQRAGTQTNLYHWLSWFSSLQTADDGTSWPPVISLITLKKFNPLTTPKTKISFQHVINKNY